MAVAVIMPRQGQSVESCIITEWNKKEGDPVAEGDVLFSYETDKASFTEEAKASGTLLKILAQEGDDIPVLENVAIIGEPGEDIMALIQEQAEGTGQIEQSADDAVPAAQETSHVTAQAAPAAASVSPDGHPAASPRARLLASEQGLDVADASPTGPHGRIIERDVRRLIAEGGHKSAAPEPVQTAGMQTEYTDIPLSNVRRIIGKSMHASLQNMAQLTLTASFDASQILAYREDVKDQRDALGLANITLNDMVLFAASRVLPEHPDINAHYLDDKIRQFAHASIGIAVDTPRGLLVPTLAAADTMSLNVLSKNARALINQAQEGSISPDLLSGASFTVTNLGSFGIESFTPVVNPPQVAILGVNTIETRVREEDGLMVPYQAMGLSLTFDHRAIDGAPAARFLKALCSALANFTLLLAK